VGQTVWLRLVERLGAVRDPAALAGWLGTTTQRECLRVLRLNQRLRRVEEAAQRDPTGERTVDPGAPIEDWLLEEERNAALRAARDVPRRFVEAGQAALAWHNIDAELAALTYDSAAERPERLGATRAEQLGATRAEQLGATRAESATLRALTFASNRLSIHL